MTDASVSVVICAYADARWSETCAAVDSVRVQRVPGAEIILVVDHNPPLYRRLANAHPDVTVVENGGAPGLSGARNTGVARSRGEIVVFLDDDAAAEPGWLTFLCAAYADPAVIGVGGLIVPRWETSRPRWFPAEFYWVVGCSYLGIPGGSDPVRNLLGANMSFRRQAFGLAGGFRTGIGRTAGRRPLGCEETEFCIRLGQLSPGSALLMENRAAVSHLVPGARCRFSYFMSRCFAEGLSKALVAASVGGTDGLSSERRYATRVLPAGIARAVSAARHGEFRALGRAGAIVAGLTATAAGYVLGSARQRIHPGKATATWAGKAGAST
jgi:hypothetical protein